MSTSILYFYIFFHLNSTCIKYLCFRLFRYKVHINVITNYDINNRVCALV